MVINKERRFIQNEALNALHANNYNGIFILPTGTGKSWVLIECLKRLVEKYDYKKVWYLCNSKDLRDRDFPKELDDWGMGHLKQYITFMCYQTAYKLTDEKVDVVIADEFDYSLSPEYHKVYLNNTFKHHIFTTAYIENDKLPLVEEIGVPIIYEKSLGDVEEKEVLNKSKYFFVNFLMSEEETRQYILLSKKIEVARVDMDVAKALNPKNLKWRKLQYENAIRERKRYLNSLESSAFHCRKLMQEIYDTDKSCKILTFCELTKQADNVSKYTYHNASDQDTLDKFRNDEIQCLAVCGKINRGVNISNVKYMIFESCNMSRTQLIQRLGRGKRLKKDEVLNVYFLVPCYQENGKLKFTKVRDWISTAAASLDMSSATLYRFKS